MAFFVPLIVGIAAIAGGTTVGIFAVKDQPETIITNTIDNEFNQTINQTLTSTIDNATSAFCQNVQEVVNTKGCTVNFATQVCDASIVASLMASNTLTAETMQDLYKSTVQDASFVNEQSAAKALFDEEYSNVSNHEKNKINMTANVALHLYTDCTRNISNVNLQSVRDTECEEYNVINFAAQTSSSSIIADCAIEQAGTSKASQFLTAISQQTASVTKKGGYMWDLIILLLMIPLLLFLIPYAIRKGFTKGMSGRTKVAFALSIITLIIATVWWPGFLSYRLGVFPWPYPWDQRPMGDDQGPVCGPTGEITRNDMIVNQFMWWDNECLVSTQGGQQPGVCTTSEQSIHYEQCGLFNTTNPCDDTDFLSDSVLYRDYLAACARGPDPGFVGFCEMGELAQKTFVDLPTLGLDDKVPAYGDTCKRCDNPSDALFGLYIDANADCSTASVDPLAFAAVGKTTNPNTGVVSDAVCEAADAGFCYDTMADLTAAFADDCSNEGYQTRKRQLSKMLRQCDDINAALTAGGFTDFVNTPSNPVSLEVQCQGLRPSNWMDCNSDGTCNYIPDGCTLVGTASPAAGPSNIDSYDCSGVLDEVVKACRNDFTDCSDPDYVKDKKIQDGFAQLCKDRYEQWKKLNPTAWIATLAFYAVVIVITLLLFWQNRAEWNPNMAGMRAAPPLGGGGGGGLGQPRYVTSVMYGGSTKWYILITLIGFWLAAAVPFGLLGAAYQMPPVYKKDDVSGQSWTDRNVENFDPGKQLTMGWVWTSIATVMLVAFVVGMIRTRNYNFGPHAGSYTAGGRRASI